LKTSYLSIFFAIAILSLFGALSSLLIIQNHETPNIPGHTQKVVQLKESTTQTFEIVETEVRVNYQRDSSQEIGVLLTVNKENTRKAKRSLKSKGILVAAYDVGSVIAANIPQDQIDILVQEGLINAILPNRQVTAFDIDEVSETGANIFWNLGFTGKGVKVAILDTGINSNKVIAERDFVGSGTTIDENSHGTRIAEIILAMAPDIKLINAKVLDKDGLGSEASVIAGINYAIREGADIISLSLGGLFDDINSPLVSAVEEVIGDGVIVVIAAGNCGISSYCSGFTGIATPGNAPNAITVGSVNGNSEVSYSAGENFGDYIKPDVVAPESANSLSGTSASTPFVAGAAALILERYDASPLQTKYLIENNADDLGESGKDIIFGSGKLSLNFLKEELKEEKIVYEPEQVVNSNIPIYAFEQAAVVSNAHPTWSVFAAWDSANFPKYGFDVLDDSFMIVTGLATSSALDRSSVMIWDGVKWNGNNGTIPFVGFGLSESMFSASIYNRTFAVIGGTSKDNSSSGDIYSTAYIWDGSGLTRYKFGSPDTTAETSIIETYVKSPTEAYSLVADGEIFMFDGSSWTSVSSGLGNILVGFQRNVTSSLLDENNMLLAYGIGELIFSSTHKSAIHYYDGILWKNTTISKSTNGCKFNKVELLSPDLGYAICGTMVLKWNGASWNLAYNGTQQLNDFSFADENFGFVAAANETLVQYSKGTWTTQQYPGEFIGFGSCNTNFEFEKVYLRDRNEGYASGLCKSGLTGRIINSNWLWDGNVWNKVTANVTTPLPSDLAINSESPPSLMNTFRTTPWKFKEANGSMYAFGYDDLGVLSPQFIGKDKRIGYNAAVLKLKKALSLNIPGIEIAVDGTGSIDLTNHTVNKKPVTYSIFSENVAEVDCSIAGSILIATGMSGFEGVGTCKVKASTTENKEVISDALIYAGVLPVQHDVFISSPDIRFFSAGTPNIRIHSVSGSGFAEINVTLIESANNKILNEQIFKITSFDKSQDVTVFNPVFIVGRGNYLTVVVDSTNALSETDKSNNRAKSRFKKDDVYLNFTIEPGFVDSITNYLSGEFTDYNIIPIPSIADFTINIGYNLGDTKLGCRNGVVYSNGKAETQPHTGAVFTSGSVINVCGSRIEGLVNAVRHLNKRNLLNNKEFAFTKGNNAAIATLDFIRSQRSIDASVITRTLYGGLEANEKVVIDVDGKFLRLKNFKPIVTQSFLDYLFGVDNSKPWLEPVVMAGGLWSDIDAWKKTGREIAIGVEDGYLTDSIKYAPRDVWLAELTGGPGIDCSTCVDYTYDDVIDKHWVASVGGVMKLTGKSQVAYVGHSNGGRAGLDGLANWSTSGKAFAGTLSNGTVFNLPPNPINTFIGVGVPGAFGNLSLLAKIVKNNKAEINSDMQTRGLTHIYLGDVIAKFLSGINIKAGDTAISFNLWKRYADFIDFTTDAQPGTGVSLDKSLIIGGISPFSISQTDNIVPISDIDHIYSNIAVNIGSQNKKNLVHVSGRHKGMTENRIIKTTVKEFLNEYPLTTSIKNEVTG